MNFRKEGWAGLGGEVLSASEDRGADKHILGCFVEHCFFRTSFNRTSHYPSLKSVFFMCKSGIDKSKGKNGVQRPSPKVPLHAGRTGAEKHSWLTSRYQPVLSRV